MADLHPEPAADWSTRITALWRVADTLTPQELVRSVDALAAERPPQDAAALFERACARDTAGLEAEAETLYRAALADDALDDHRRARASLQLGSTLRLLGRLDESEALLREQLARSQAPGAPLRDEARALLALTRLAQGEPMEAAALALQALAPHLTRYQRSVTTQAELLTRAQA